MDVFNRIKTTVSNFSNVLLGNPVTREYEILEHIASAGPSLLWKVYKGFKKTTKEGAAVFVFEKKLLEKYPKNEREEILAILKKGVANLTKLRHPCILTVQQSLEESRESLAFASEPVFASLANILGYLENMPLPPPKCLKEFELFDIEIKYGFLQVTEGLAFLHSDVKMMHGNICPESILVNQNGAWKLAGFDFCFQFPPNSLPGSSLNVDELNIDLPPPCHPNLDYTAPERVLGCSASMSSDMFSLGLLFFAVHNQGKSLLLNSGCSMHSIKQNFNNMKSIPSTNLNCLPADSRDHVKLLLSLTPELRPDAFQTSKLPMFEDVGVKTLQYLDSLYQWDNLQKSKFYKDLPQILAKMPKRVSLHRIIPCLAKEYHSPEMVPFVLPNVLIIAEEATKEEFQSLILQDMIPLFRLQEPIQITFIFMQKMELLLSKCPPTVITNHVMPMIYRALESDAQQIQEQCLSIIPKFASLIEYAAMKNALLPRIKKLCLSTSYLSVRVNCLVCIGKLLEHLDKWLVLDEILPFLPQIPSKEPAVLMGVLGILKLTMSHKKLGITKEIMASRIIPFLMPLSIENGLTLNQFNAVIAVIKDMVNYVEEEHRKKLEQLNSIRQEHSSTLEMTQMINSSSNDFVGDFSSETNKSEVNDLFQNLNLSLSGISSQAANTLGKNYTQPVKSPYTDHKDNSKPLNLTLEEKKSLAWSQEQQRKWNSTAQKTISPSLDAASRLINSNLQKLTSSSVSDGILNSSVSNTSFPVNLMPTSHGTSYSSPPPNSSVPFPVNFIPSSLGTCYSSLPMMQQTLKPSTPELQSLWTNAAASQIASKSTPQFSPLYSPPSAKSELDDLLG